jgi:hypothetical protein
MSSFTFIVVSFKHAYKFLGPLQKIKTTYEIAF